MNFAVSGEIIVMIMSLVKKGPLVIPMKPRNAAEMTVLNSHSGLRNKISKSYSLGLIAKLVPIKLSKYHNFSQNSTHS